MKTKTVSHSDRGNARAEPKAVSHLLQVYERRLGSKSFLSPAEVATAFSVSITTVYAWIDAGLIEAVNLSSNDNRPRYSVHAESLLKFVQSRIVGKK